MGSANPEQTINNIAAQNPGVKSAVDITMQYGNGDPRTAFFNYARDKGKNALAQTILNKLGLS